MGASILGLLERGSRKLEQPVRMPEFELREIVNGWLVTVRSSQGTEQYTASILGEATEKMRSLAERWERVVEQWRRSSEAPTYGPTWLAQQHEGQPAVLRYGSSPHTAAFGSSAPLGSDSASASPTSSSGRHQV